MTYTSTAVPAITASQGQKEVTANGLFEADHPAMLFGVDLTTTSALVLGLIGGVLPVGSALTVIANQTITLTASATNYVWAEITGSPAAWALMQSTSAPSGWPDLGVSMIALYKLVTGTTTVTSVPEVWRSLTAMAASSVGGGAPTGAAGGDLSGTYPNPVVGANKVTVAKMSASTGDVFFGRDTAGAGAGEEITVAAAKALLGLTGTNSGDQTITLTGDVTGTGTGSFATAIANNAVVTAKILDDNVTNAKLADMVASTIKGRDSGGGTGNPQDLSVAQVNALLGPSVVVLSVAYAASVTVNLAAYAMNDVVVVELGALTGNITFNITNGFDGQVIRVRLSQDSTGGWTFTGGANIAYSADTPAPTLTTTANKMDRFAFEWRTITSTADLVAVNRGYL